MALVETILVEVAKKLVLRLGSFAYEEVAFAWGLKTELAKLRDTMDTITARLRDAEEAQLNRTSHIDRDWLDKLQTAVYEADDLFDEIRTLAEKKRLMEGNAFQKEVRLFFSPSNQLVFCFKECQRIKAIRGNLAEISKDRKHFGSASARVVDKVRENDMIVGGVTRETYSYLDDKEVVGRDVEKKMIIDKLLDSRVKEVVSVIPIIGVGGLGKTTLAQLVFNDKVVRENFDLMLWVSVPRDIRLNEVIRDIIASASEDEKQRSRRKKKHEDEKPSNLNLEQLTNHLSRHITGKKYMLVLDDVWDENPRKWESLKPLLTRGVAHGSKVLVTTRSLVVGRIMGTIPPCELQPLNQDESWSLFQKIAFKEAHELGLRKLGREILGLCKNVPLVIRVIAGVLANKLTVQEWSSFITDELSNLELYEDNVMPTLKLSYDHLCPKLKACFSYCSLFPRGHEFDTSKLVSLWIAQDFIDPPRSRSQSLEDMGKEYLDNLLNKSLLEGDESQGTCKLHDLMYDLCCSVARGQCRMVRSVGNSFGRSTRHISIGYQVDSSWKISTSLQSIKQLRTFLFTERPCYGTKMSMSVCEDLISSFRCLRVLDLHNMGIEELPKAIGKLIHLRYLDLSRNKSLKELPNSVTLLHNLQFLDLRGCDLLLKNPKDLKKLVNLRHFWLPHDLSYEIDSEINFPSGVGNLTNLQTLNYFCITINDSLSSCGGQNKFTGGCLRDLRYLNNLKGLLKIYLKTSYPNMALDAREANLKAKKNLESLVFRFPDDIGAEENEMVLENLQPHDKLSNLMIEYYQGVKFPTWMGMNQLASSLSHLGCISITHCPNVQHLPSFAHLPHLKSLVLWSLGVEYIESVEFEAGSSSSSLPSYVMFFPSLTSIHLLNLLRLKAWGRSLTTVENLSFSCVSDLKIFDCPHLESMPSCPNVESLSFGERLSQSLGILKLPAPNNSPWVPKLKSLEVWDVQKLASLPREYLQQVTQLQGAYFNNNAEEYLMAFKGFVSIRTLVLSDTDGIMPLSTIAHQLSSLERMELLCCNFNYENYSYDSWELLRSLRSVIFCNDELNFAGTGVEGLLKGLQYVTALQSLELRECCHLEALPDGIGNLVSLSSLEIYECPRLASFPQEMQRLTNLKLLVVDNCPKLAPRCQREVGNLWPKIQHIPDIIIRT